MPNSPQSVVVCDRYRAYFNICTHLSFRRSCCEGIATTLTLERCFPNYRTAARTTKPLHFPLQTLHIDICCLEWLNMQGNRCEGSWLPIAKGGSQLPQKLLPSLSNLETSPIDRKQVRKKEHNETLQLTIIPFVTTKSKPIFLSTSPIMPRFRCESV